MKIVTDLSNSFNPVPKPGQKNTKHLEKVKQKKTEKVIKKVQIKQKSKKLANLEKKRFSILTDNLEICYICTKRKKDDLHEVFGGNNRKKSMIWGLVVPICRKCHRDWDSNKELKKEIQQESQRRFEKKYGHELFMAEFKKNYL